METCISIPSVLRSILNNLDTFYLASTCRFVNSSWNYECCRIIESRVTISFWKDWKQIEKYNKTFSSPIDRVSVRFTSFRFAYGLFEDAIQDRAYGYLDKLRYALGRFRELHGESIQKLKYCLAPILPLGNSDPRISTVVMYEEFLKMLHAVPNVKHLDVLIMLKNNEDPTDEVFDVQEFANQFGHLELSSLESILLSIYYSFDIPEEFETIPLPKTEEMIDVLVQKLLCSSPSLKSLRVKEENYKNTPIKPHWLKMSSVQKNLPSVSKTLRSFHVNYIMNESNLLDLCQLDNLVEFSGKIDESVTSETLQLFLNRFRKTLWKVYLQSFSDDSRKLLLASHELSADGKCVLENLILEDFEGDVNWEMFPKLKSLTLTHNNAHEKLCSLSSYLKNDEDNSSLTIKRLEINNGQTSGTSPPKHGSSKTLFDLPCCFLQNLTSLSLSRFNPLPIEKIFRECVKLRKLSIEKCSPISDQAICGIRSSILSRISPTYELQDKAEDEDEIEDRQIMRMVESVKANADSFREAPSIANLKGLQILKFEGEFGDASVLYGIMLCERLIDLELNSKTLTWRAEKIAKTVLKDLIHLRINERKSQN